MPLLSQTANSIQCSDVLPCKNCEGVRDTEKIGLSGILQSVCIQSDITQMNIFASGDLRNPLHQYSFPLSYDIPLTYNRREGLLGGQIDIWNDTDLIPKLWGTVWIHVHDAERVVRRRVDSDPSRYSCHILPETCWAVDNNELFRLMAVLISVFTEPEIYSTVNISVHQGEMISKSLGTHCMRFIHSSIRKMRTTNVSKSSQVDFFLVLNSLELLVTRLLWMPIMETMFHGLGDMAMHLLYYLRYVIKDLEKRVTGLEDDCIMRCHLQQLILEHLLHRDLPELNDQKILYEDYEDLRDPECYERFQDTSYETVRTGMDFEEEEESEEYDFDTYQGIFW